VMAKIPEWLSMSALSEQADEMIEDDAASTRTANAAVVVVAGADAAGQRLDQWLASQLGPDISRNRVQMLIRQAAVSIEDKPVSEARRKMAAGERVLVRMPEPEPAEPRGEAIP